MEWFKYELLIKRWLTKKNCSPLDFLANSGFPTKPEIFNNSVSSCTGTNFSFILAPKIWMMRCRNGSDLKSKRSLSLWCMEKLICGWAIATLWNSSIICLNSTGSDFRKFRLAGMLKNRFLTATEVPSEVETTSSDLSLLPSILTAVPKDSPLNLVFNSIWAMAAILAKASPRNPLVLRQNKSSAVVILEVAWRSKQSRASEAPIPIPLSITWTSVLPEFLMMSLIWEAPASMAFSSNSFTTEAGRWTTSPAAIWLATWSGRSWMIFAIN